MADLDVDGVCGRKRDQYSHSDWFGSPARWGQGEDSCDEGESAEVCGTRCAAKRVGAERPKGGCVDRRTEGSSNLGVIEGCFRGFRGYLVGDASVHGPAFLLVHLTCTKLPASAPSVNRANTI